MGDWSESEAHTAPALLVLAERMRDPILHREPPIDDMTESGSRVACADAHTLSIARLGQVEGDEVRGEQRHLAVSHLASLERLLDMSVAHAAALCEGVANRLACREEWRSVEQGSPSARHANAPGRRLRALTAVDEP